MLKKKVVLVTGAGSGIGRAVSLVCAREGAAVLVSDIDADSARATADMVRELGSEVLPMVADVGNPDDCKTLVERCCAHFGRLDVACNNAGIGGASLPTVDYPLEEWARVIRVNLSGIFYGMKYQIEAMLRNHASASGARGSVVNVASILGAVGFATAPAYAAAKHGVVGLTHSAALEYSARGVRCERGRPGLHSHAHDRAAGKRCRGGGQAGCGAPDRPTGRGGGSGRAGGLAGVGSGLVRDRVLPPGGRRLPGPLNRIRIRRPRSGRCALPGARPADRCA
jgi:NAD(P)-dependent dehydrogenase (short-subunit alcohol dehydrogenase family)